MSKAKGKPKGKGSGWRRGKKGATPAQRQGRRGRTEKKPRQRPMLTPEQVAQEERRTQAIALYRTGQWTQAQIAEALGVNQSTVSRDLGLLVHQRFPAEQEHDVKALREREVRVADRVAEAAWQAWDQGGMFGPDSRHLRNVLAASSQRSKLLGTYAPTKVIAAPASLSELLGRAIDDEHGAHNG